MLPMFIQAAVAGNICLSLVQYVLYTKVILAGPTERDPRGQQPPKIALIKKTPENCGLWK